MLAYSTPEYHHCLDNRDFRDSVYEPEADTFLFLTALDQERGFLQKLSPRRCVEIGCGSGTVITHLFAVLNTESEPSSAAVTAGTALVQTASDTSYAVVDVNPMALQATALTWKNTLEKHFFPLVKQQRRDTVEGEEADDSIVCFASEANQPQSTPCGRIPFYARSQQPCTLTLFHGDLLSAFAPENCLDVVLFNPPYVPTSQEELQAAIAQKDVITAAWCGGPRGRVVLDRFLTMLPRYLSPMGVCYIVLIRENDEADVAHFVEQAFRTHASLPPLSNAEGETESYTLMEVVARRYTGEHLSVHRISYNPRFANAC